MSKTNKSFMAIATGKESVESANFAKYLGVGVFTVVGVNPSREELEKIYNTTIEKDPEYISKTDDGIKQIRIDIILKSVAEKNNGIEMLTKASIFLTQAPRISKTNKIQVINIYGETAWIDIEVAKTGVIPEGMEWFEGPYRPAYNGEEDLTGFIKAYLNIPNKSYKKASGEIITLKDKKEAEASLENIDKYFTGNVKEIKDAIACRPDNKVKADVGIKTTEDNKQYQTVYSKMFIKYGITDYSKLDKHIKETQNAGALVGIEFSILPLHEYNVEATNFTPNGSSVPSTPPAPQADAMAAFFNANKGINQ